MIPSIVEMKNNAVEMIPSMAEMISTIDGIKITTD